MANRAELQRLLDLLDEATSAIDAATYLLRDVLYDEDGGPDAVDE